MKRTFAAASAAMARPAGCTQRGDVRVISSKLLPRPVRMSKGGSLLIKVTGKTKPGKYEIVLLCEDKHNQPDSVDMKTVRIYKVLGAFQQPGQPALPAAFKPDVTVSSGPPPAAHQAQAEGALARQTSGPPRVACMLLVLSRATRGPPFQPVRLPRARLFPPAPARGR